MIMVTFVTNWLTFGKGGADATQTDDTAKGRRGDSFEGLAA
jgi:hypothetical protein